MPSCSTSPAACASTCRKPWSAACAQSCGPSRRSAGWSRTGRRSTPITHASRRTVFWPTTRRCCRRAVNQFDVVANPFPRSRERQPFLVALQSDLLMRHLDTLVVAPLERAASSTFADRLNPQVEIDGDAFVLITQEIVTVRKSVLGKTHASIARERDKIIGALDMLFTGF